MLLPRLVIGASLLLAACAQDPKALQITDANKDSFMDSIKGSKGLTVEEVGLLVSLQMRRAAQKTLGNEPGSIVGKTLGALIDDERRLRADAKAKAAEQDRLAADAKAKEEARATELRKAINLSVFEKTFRSSDYQDYIVIKCAYENTSGKDIRAFRGAVRFTDLFGKEIYTTSLTVSDPVTAGTKTTWVGQIRYNQFSSEQTQLRNAALADMKIVWQPASVMFVDGSVIGEQAAQ